VKKSQVGIDSKHKEQLENLRFKMQGREFKKSPAFSKMLEELDIQEILSRPGPDVFSVDNIRPDMVFTHEAWPHVDESYEGEVFVTMTISKAHYSFGCLSVPGEVRASQGDIFGVEPLELHWLRPDPLVAEPWVALQWLVPKENLDEFLVKFEEKLSTWNEPSFVLPTLE